MSNIATMTLEALLAAVAGAETDCVCWHVIDLNRGRSETIRKAPDLDCQKCKGTGRVNALPVTVRESCSQCFGKGYVRDKQGLCYPCAYCGGARGEFGFDSVGDASRGRGWNPSRDLAVWIRASLPIVSGVGALLTDEVVAAGQEIEVLVHTLAHALEAQGAKLPDGLWAMKEMPCP